MDISLCNLEAIEEDLSNKVQYKQEQVKKLHESIIDNESNMCIVKKRIDTTRQMYDEALGKVFDNIMVYQKTINDKLTNLKKDENIFCIYKELHSNACQFFSKQDFTEVTSKLKQQPPDTYISQLYRLFSGNTDTWTDMTDPIWNTEEYIKTISSKLKEEEKEYQELESLHISHKDETKKLQKQIEIMTMEIKDVKKLREKYVTIAGKLDEKSN